MPDREFNQTLEETAEALNGAAEDAYNVRREALNLAARQRGLIGEGEDLIEEYRETGIGALNGVQEWLEQDKRDVDDVQALLDDIEEQSNSSEGLLNRRGFTFGAGVITASLFFGGFLWQESQENAGSQRQITRGTYNADQLREIEDCLEGETDLRGLDGNFDDLLNKDDREIKELEYVFDETGPSSGVSSSIRYTVELEGGGTHELGWYSAQNSDVEILAEASTYDDLSNYEEENC